MNSEGTVLVHIRKSVKTDDCRHWDVGYDRFFRYYLYTKSMSTSVNPNPNSLIKDAVIIRDFNRDFNNDGQADIFWRNSDTGQNGIWLMSGTKPNYYTSAEFVQPPVPIAWDYTTGDFDNDGNSDLFWHNSDTGDNAIWLMNGTTYRDGGAVPLGETLSGKSWDYSTGDFGGDDGSDIFLRNFQTGENKIWLTTVNGTNINIIDQPSVPRLDKEWEYSIADFNKDGQTDIFWRNESTGENNIWLRDGVTFNEENPLTPVPLGWQYSIADFNGDGRTDIFWRNESTEQSAVWLMDGNNYIPNGAVFLPTNVPAAWDANIGDFDGDGRTDILWRNSQTGENGIWLINDTGTSYKAAEFLPNVPLAWNAGITDFNGDGKSDIFWRNSQTGEDAVWLMNGTTYTDADFLATVPTSWSSI